MAPDKDQLKRHIHKSDLTAIEKRYLEGLVDAQYKTDGRRLIDADALFKCDTCYHMQNGGCTTYCDSGESYRPDMHKLEIIEAEPVRHGYWKHETKENVWGNMVKIRRCSECGKYSYKNKAFEFDFPNCPCCRAIMDKEEVT